MFALRRAAVFALLALLLATSAPSYASNLPNGFSESLIASGIDFPTAMEFAPDGRLFVLQQSGEVRVIKDGTLLPTPFLTVNVEHDGERGLLGITFDPDFETNHYLYLYYTSPDTPIHNRVSRFTANGDVAFPNSEVVLMDLENLSSARNHNGGAMHFDHDGTLFVAVGENGYSPNAQTLTNRLGKLLRINADGSIPTDNPFYNQLTGVNRAIWAYGLRNPYTFAVGETRMFINDVGLHTWEEINEAVAGSNYGWPTTEGETSDPDFRSPLYVYPHGDDNQSGCAITGGTFYEPEASQFPAGYVGDYFFADFCNAWIRRYDPVTDSAQAFITDTAGGIVDLDVAADGSLYYLSRGGNAVYRIEYGEHAPVITQNPQDAIVAVGQDATFTCSASAAPPATYQWLRDNAEISGETDNTYTLVNPQLADDGATFACRADNVYGSDTSDPATLTVTDGQRPTATITTPLNGSLYRGSMVITFAGTANDAEDGALPASAYTWWIDFHHDAHTHPAVLPFSGQTNGTFTVPNMGETSVNVWYRIHLQVIDSDGLTREVTRDVLPIITRLSFTSSVADAEIALDGSPMTPPLSVLAVAGMRRTIGAPEPQTISGQQWIFESWSDGGAASHLITVPLSDASYRVTWQQAGQPQTPSLALPLNGAQVDTQTPLFDWLPATRATSYHLVVDDDPAFGSPIVDEVTIATEFHSPPLPFSTYYWRVRGENALGQSAWSARRTLVIQSGTGSVPQRNVFTTDAPTLRWSALSWASGYAIQVDNDADFSSPEYARNKLSAVPEVHITHLEEGRYFWRVRGRRSDGTSGAWSAPDSFTIDLP